MEIETLTHGVVAHAGDRNIATLQLLLGRSQLNRTFPNVNANMVKPTSNPLGRTGCRSHFDQE